MGLNQWNNNQRIRDHMENEQLEQQYRGDDPVKNREHYGSRILLWIALLAVLFALLSLFLRF